MRVEASLTAQPRGRPRTHWSLIAAIGKFWGRTAVKAHSSLASADNNRECHAVHVLSPLINWSGINMLVFPSLILLLPVFNSVKPLWRSHLTGEMGTLRGGGSRNFSKHRLCPQRKVLCNIFLSFRILLTPFQEPLWKAVVCYAFTQICAFFPKCAFSHLGSFLIRLK